MGLLVLQHAHLQVDICTILYEALEGLHIPHLSRIMQRLRTVLQAKHGSA